MCYYNITGLYIQHYMKTLLQKIRFAEMSYPEHM